MPPGIYSRYRFCTALTDSLGRTYLSERDPFTYRDLADNIQHTAIDGDTWESIAGTYYKDYFPKPSELFWVVADYNGVVDVTLVIEAGTVVWLPHPTVVAEQILNEARRFAAAV